MTKVKHLSSNSEYLFNRLSAKQKRNTRIIPNFYSKTVEIHTANENSKSDYILSVSNGFGNRKNVITGLKAFHIFKQNNKNFEYLLIGDGMEPGGPAYRYARENNLLEGIKFLGKQPYMEVLNFISKAAIFLHPSREESFGMVVLEAMALGTLVVGGRRSGNVPYLLGHGDFGILADVDSPADVAKALEKAIQPDINDGLVMKAREYAKKNFSQDIILQQYIDYYQEVLCQTTLETRFSL